MDNKKTLQLFGILFFITAIGELLELIDIAPNNEIINIGLSIVRLAGIILIVQSGTILKASPFIQIIYFLMGVTILGALFKIMYWPYSNLMLTTGLLGITLVYFIRFYKKISKKQLDLLKFLWVMAFCISAILKINHWPWGNELLSIQMVLFLILLFSFLYKLMDITKPKAQQ